MGGRNDESLEVDHLLGMQGASPVSSVVGFMWMREFDRYTDNTGLCIMANAHHLWDVGGKRLSFHIFMLWSNPSVTLAVLSLCKFYHCHHANERVVGWDL